jgi:hypothetical protein
MRLITIQDSCETNSGFDLHFIIPSSIETPEAIRVVDESVRQVKAEHPQDYNYQDLEAKLTPLGFVAPYYYDANEKW